MSTIRIESKAASDLSRVYLWLSQHRGDVVALEPGKRLALGVPISGARAVIVAAVLQDDRRPGVQLGGVLRALAHVTQLEGTRLVFEVRSTGGLDAETVEEVGAAVVRAVSARIAEADLETKVA